MSGIWSLSATGGTGIFHFRQMLTTDLVSGCRTQLPFKFFGPESQSLFEFFEVAP
jgi:hypothetical protein